jgi:hypothetical protein
MPPLAAAGWLASFFRAIRHADTPHCQRCAVLPLAITPLTWLPATHISHAAIISAFDY